MSQTAPSHIKHPKNRNENRIAIVVLLQHTIIDVADRMRDAHGKHHIELAYDPIHFNAVACNYHYVFVADSAPGGGVQVHTWSGQHTHRLSSAQLGLRDPDWIWAINWSYPDMFSGEQRDTLQLAVGDYCSETVYSLHAYEVSEFQAEVAWCGYIFVIGYLKKAQDSKVNL